jgi:hypothetical protein
MFADTETRSGGFERSRRRWGTAGLLAVVAAGLFAAAPAGASAASVPPLVTHSAKGGKLQGGRLVLRGVSGRVTYPTGGGSSGRLSVRRMHRRVFLPGKPAMGRLHVAGRRGGADPTFRLSNPRYNAARHTVSYRAKPLTNKPLSGGAARAAGIPVRRFGAASLSIVPHPTVTSGGDDDGNTCPVFLHNDTGQTLTLQSSSKMDTDSWTQYGEPPTSVDDGETAVIQSDSPSAEVACGNTSTWTGPATFTITSTASEGGDATTTCTADSSDWGCVKDPNNEYEWFVLDT